MKKILVALAFGIASITAFAEASFDQIQGLIQQGQYQAAEQGLEVIIKNHPQSAKAFYAMAQAQAGLGNLEKAQKALNIATGLNPSLDFAPASSVASLKEAITPQTKKIEAVEESHFLRNLVFVGMLVLFTAAMYFLYSVYARKRDEEEKGGTCPAGFGPKDPTPSGPTAKEETAKAYSSAYTPRPAYRGTTQTTTPAPVASTPSHTTVVNNNSGSNDMLTGVLIGNMISNSGGHHHDNERVVTREVVREVPATRRDSSWDDTPSYTPSPTQSVRESKSSSWDDSSSSSSSRSSSWDDSSSKSSSSSWSSSSDSSSSSSWDSGSSSSSSDSSW